MRVSKYIPQMTTYAINWRNSFCNKKTRFNLAEYEMVDYTQASFALKSLKRFSTKKHQKQIYETIYIGGKLHFLHLCEQFFYMVLLIKKNFRVIL